LTALAGAAPVVFTQWNGRGAFGEGARIAVWRAGVVRVLSAGFTSAADPDISWDGKRILFAGQRTAGGLWQVYEMRADGTGVRQVVTTAWDCRQPIYQSKIFYLDDAQPEPQITFVSKAGGATDHLFSARLDGSGIRQLTYGLGDERDPFLNEDGRILYASGTEAGSALFGVNLDGTDASAFAQEEGRAAKRMPARTAGRMVVFVESENRTDWDGAGPLAAVDLRRNLHSYREWTRGGLYAWPSPAVDGHVLVSKRQAGGKHAVYRFDPASGAEQLLFRGDWHAAQPKELAARTMPDGRASVVEEKEKSGTLYCLSVHESDQPDVAKRAVKVRILDAGSGAIRGEASLEKDGSFQMRLPANWAFRVELADNDGKPLRRSAPIWVKNKEQRGCIGCHEDRERTPENRFAEALAKPAVVVDGGGK
jgi:hypothetical protein